MLGYHSEMHPADQRLAAAEWINPMPAGNCLI